MISYVVDGYGCLCLRMICVGLFGFTCIIVVVNFGVCMFGFFFEFKVVLDV